MAYTIDREALPANGFAPLNGRFSQSYKAKPKAVLVVARAALSLFIGHVLNKHKNNDQNDQIFHSLTPCWGPRFNRLPLLETHSLSSLYHPPADEIKTWRQIINSLKILALMMRVF